MDIQAIIDQVMQAVQAAPEKVNDLLADPKAAIEDITGQQLGEGELAQIVAAVQDKFAAGELDLSQLDLSALDLSKIGGLGSLLGGAGGALGGIVSGLEGLFKK